LGACQPDEAKRYAEALSMAYHRQQGVDTAIVRIFNTYGPRMRPNDGRSQTRSFCFVSDLIAGMIALAESGYHDPVNIGNPDEFTLLELAETIVELTSSKSGIVHEALPIDDPKVRRPDISLAQQVLGWQPKVGLREGLGLTLERAGTEQLIGVG
jgi:dTDP-glucose 4,6-dehydratase